jgi:hypothetical protein
MIARKRLPEWDRQKWDRHNRTGRTLQAEQDKQNRKYRLPRKNCKDRTAKIEQDFQEKTGRAGLQ